MFIHGDDWTIVRSLNLFHYRNTSNLIYSRMLFLYLISHPNLPFRSVYLDYIIKIFSCQCVVSVCLPISKCHLSTEFSRWLITSVHIWTGEDCAFTSYSWIQTRKHFQEARSYFHFSLFHAKMLIIFISYFDAPRKQ